VEGTAGASPRRGEATAAEGRSAEHVSVRDSGVEPVRGWCDQELQCELPGLGLVCAAVGLGGRRSPTGASPPSVMASLSELSNRWRGQRAVGVRQEPVPAAYRVFFRQIGLDPDVTRTPIERAALARMLEGGFLSRGLLADVITLALLDTAVPVWALDADTVEGPLGIRASRPAERLGRGADGPVLGGGRLVVADADRAVAILFDDPPGEHRTKRSTRRLLLYAVQVAGVPSLHVEETLWACHAALAEACS
jgi:DNA/RNA-binding domain of Phe-tRNA-synthetase-like protein